MNNTSENFTSFKETIIEILQARLGENYTVYSQKVRKNNGIQLTGLVAKHTESNTSPTIYIDDFYKEGITKKEVEQIAAALYDDFKTAEYNKDIDMSDFLDFTKAGRKIAFKLVNADKNQELLALVPHKLLYNLAIVFYYTVQEAPFYGKAAVLIYNSHMKQWNTDTEELYRIALENTPKMFPAVVENMESIMCTILREELGRDISGQKGRKRQEEELFDEEWINELVRQMAEDGGRAGMPMYVLTNRQKLQGAACILYPGFLKEFAEKMQQDFYILPSSVHEVILVPGEIDTEDRELKEIVTDINHTQVAEEEILADSVYFYDRKLDKVVWVS